MKAGFRLLGLAAAGWLMAGACSGAPILIDHRNTDITQLTETQINRAKAKLHIAYGHTSHGSQLIDGKRWDGCDPAGYARSFKLHAMSDSSPLLASR